MCGFGGIVNSAKPVEREKALEVARCVSFRGPDSTNVALFDKQWNPETSTGNTALFFNRLAIIDLDPRSNQPFMDEHHLLIFNGEIYNYRALKSELTSLGVQFKTTSDTEVLFHALANWGVEAIKKLNGMFAFFWMNRKDQSFIIARDRIGIKPVYYKIENETLIFASEMDTIIRFSDEKQRVSADAIQRYLCLQYVPTPYTILENVYKLPPGHYLSGNLSMLAHRKHIKPVEFWDGYKYILSSPNEPQGNLEDILAKSVQSQMEADVPVGMFLSSGVDSSLLTAIINKHFQGRDFNFFTVAFEQDTTSDESRQASQYLKGFNNPHLHHHRLTINQDQIINKLESLYDFYDEPFGDQASLLNWMISAKAREHVTVALSGDGADEMFWGYNRYNQWKSETHRMYKHIPLMPAATRFASKLNPESRVGYTIANMGEKNPVSIHFNILRPRLFGFLPSIEKQSDLWCLKGLDNLKGREDLASVIDMKAYLADAMLYKVDRASMAASLEVRVPYLDNTVIDYALKLPLKNKSTAKFKNKAPLKELLSKLAPHYDVNMPKKGFNFPLAEWMQNQLKPMILDTITKKNLEELNLTPGPFLNIVDKFYNKNANAKDEIWYLFNLVLWHKRFKKTFPASK